MESIIIHSHLLKSLNLAAQSCSYQLLLLEEENGQFVRSAEHVSLKMVICHAMVMLVILIRIRIIGFCFSVVFLSWKVINTVQKLEII